MRRVSSLARRTRGTPVKKQLWMAALLAPACLAADAATVSASICVKGWTLRDLNPLDHIAPAATATNDFGDSWDGGSSPSVNVQGGMPSSANYPMGTGHRFTSLPLAPGSQGLYAHFWDWGSFAPGQTAAFSTMLLAPYTEISFSVRARMSGTVLAHDDPTTQLSASLWVGSGSAAPEQRLEGSLTGHGSFSHGADWTVTVTNNSAGSVEFEPIRGVDISMETAAWSD